MEWQALLLGDELSKCDRFVAVRAQSSWTNPFAKSLAIRAALLAEVAGLAGWALVDGGRAW